MTSQMMRSFLINYRTLVIPLFVVVVRLINSITPQNPTIVPIVEAIGLLVLIIWVAVRGWVELKLNLVKEYKSLMKSVKIHDKNQAIEQIFSGWNPTSPPSHITARKFFDSKQIDIDRKSNELNTKLNKLISNPYRLLYTDTTLIGTEFAELFVDIKTLYEYFALMDSEFISDLKGARNRFTEIKTAIEDDLIPIPPNHTLQGEFQ